MEILLEHGLFLGWSQVQSYNWKALALKRITYKEKGGWVKVPQGHLIIWLKILKVADFRIPA